MMQTANMITKKSGDEHRAKREPRLRALLLLIGVSAGASSSIRASVARI